MRRTHTQVDTPVTQDRSASHSRGGHAQRREGRPTERGQTPSRAGASPFGTGSAAQNDELGEDTGTAGTKSATAMVQLHGAHATATRTKRDPTSVAPEHMFKMPFWAEENPMPPYCCWLILQIGRTCQNTQRWQGGERK